MKKILSFALALSLLLGLLIGCTPQDDADYTGRYVLLPKGAEWSSLVVHWEYPDDDFDPILDSAKVDLSPIEKYINPMIDGAQVDIGLQSRRNAQQKSENEEKQ